MSVAALELDAGRGVASRASRRAVLNSLGVPIVAVLAALALGAVLIGFEGENPIAVYVEVMRGVFVAPRGLRSTAVGATPLLLMGLGLAIAYRARLFVIGAEGQYVMGAVAAMAVATAPGVRDASRWLLVPSCLVVAAVAGVVWSCIAGVLNVRFGTSLVVSSLLLTYVATAFMQWAARVGLRDPESFIPATRVVGNASLPAVAGVNVHLGFVLAVLVVPVVAVVMARTRAGFRVDVLGNNRDALDANEVTASRVLFGVLALAGAFAGVAGYVEVAGVSQRINGSFSTGYGFTAIIVALLGRLHPVGVLAAALTLSGFTIGFSAAERNYDLPSSLVGLVQALIIIFVVLGDAIASRRSAQ